jgi:predicted nucleotidyltransferase
VFVSMQFREGDLVEDVNGIVFDVKGLVHPSDRVVAFPRFVPDVEGDRKRGRTTYRKVYALSARFKLLEKRFPRYLIHDKVFGERLCEVPVGDLCNHYFPNERLQELRNRKPLDMLERDALGFLSLLKKSANVAWSALGISGSILAKLSTPTSDIDAVVYGSKNSRKVRSALEVLREKSDVVRRYHQSELRALFDFRSKDTETSFEDFVRTESRKVLQGKYDEHDYFVRCVKDWDEVNEQYGDLRYSNVGYIRIKAVIIDDSEAIFTPCLYRVESVHILEGKVFEPVSEIVSFRGRFCEQAEKNEVVMAQGKLERVRSERGEEYFRLLLGNMPSDFMVLA